MADLSSSQLYNFCNDELEGMLIHVSEYCSINSLRTQFKHHKSLFILHIDIRSMSKNLNNLKDLLMHFLCPPSLIALSENNLKPFKNNKINFPGYNFISSNKHIAKGGVCLYINKDMFFTILDDFNINCNKCENLWVKIFLNGKKSVNVGIIYKHPEYDFSEFHESMKFTKIISRSIIYRKNIRSKKNVSQKKKSFCLWWYCF